MIRAWRGSPLAPLIVLTLLSAGGTFACATPATPQAASDGPQVEPHRFRRQLNRLLAEGRYDEATRWLRTVSPDDLAIAASERADIQFMQVVASHLPPPASLPGLAPYERPARVWVIRVEGESPDVDLLRQRLLRFAAEYNHALAREERGVR